MITYEDIVAEATRQLEYGNRDDLHESWGLEKDGLDKTIQQFTLMGLNEALAGEGPMIAVATAFTSGLDLGFGLGYEQGKREAAQEAALSGLDFEPVGDES